jgi:hypothetical protein
LLCVNGSKLIQRGDDSNSDQLWQLQRIGSRINDNWFMATIGDSNANDRLEVSGEQFVVTDQSPALRNGKDKATFVTRDVEGDFDLVVRVVNAANDGSNSGLMIRNNMTTESATVAVLLNKQITTLRRAGQGEQVSLKGGEAATQPCWLKLERRGSSIKSYTSADGNSWNKVGTDSVEMNSHVFAGIVVAGHDPARKATTTFDKLSITKR